MAIVYPTEDTTLDAAPPAPPREDFLDFVENHLVISIVLGLILAVVIGYVINSVRGKTNDTSSTTSNSSAINPATGLPAGSDSTLYVPTEDFFLNYSNVTGSYNDTTNNTTTNTTTTTVNEPPPVQPPPVTIIQPPPPVTVKPPPTTTPSQPAPKPYKLVWGAKHVVTTDDTNHGSSAVAYIASQSTNIMHQSEHAPANVSISANDIVSHNPGLKTNSVLKLGQTIILPSWTNKY